MGHGVAHPIGGQQIAQAHEVGHEARAGPQVQVGRRSHLFDPPIVHANDLVGQCQRFLLVVRDHDRGDLQPALHLMDFGAHICAYACIQRRQRFVQQDQRRVHGQRARQRHALLLAAGDLSRIFFRSTGQAHQGQHFLDPVGDVLAVGALAAQADWNRMP
ncbi:hypothetical protein G6F32_015005 [Rhizopus arrhizus]|nr:hypothetical protein G6F32_015005 [Rhizopus arrhizus]